MALQFPLPKALSTASTRRGQSFTAARMEASGFAHELPLGKGGVCWMASVVNGRRVRGVGSPPAAGESDGRWLGPALAIGVGLWAMIGAGAMLLARLI
ncbi:MAG: hypothetical protein U1E52_00260 [Geminicoccaceae bacterium]